MKILLYQPQIPQNTGNIVRSCSCTNTELVLVHPLGFSTDDRMLKRAGLDYWEGVDVIEIEQHAEEWLAAREQQLFFFSSHATKPYTEAKFHQDSILIFGSETKGLPAKYRDRWAEKFYTLPMVENARCLNLASTATAVLYEALRQTEFSTLHPVPLT